ncbi:MAG: 5-(carboxyamino)imidazole ribonucleotide synthase [Cyanobacteria bacterium HKST-UBA04]|nr:5-(carboxyamino)imidazole ribonucleotide synthase [Cyanobacteria bacterium HKST-UBA04]
MSTEAAHALGLKVIVFGPDTNDGMAPPAAQVADGFIQADYTDTDALADFARQTDLVTLEFENVSPIALDTLSRLGVPVYPNKQALETFSNRLQEKTFFSTHGLPTVPFEALANLSDRAAVEAAVARIGTPCVLKTAGFGYDGKGQYRLDHPTDLAGVLEKAALDQPYIVESWVALAFEISVIGARTTLTQGGETQTAFYWPFLNHHRHHILDTTQWPAPVDATMAEAAQHLTNRILTLLDYRGLLCVEFFVTADGQLLINECAPRPHNSGHVTQHAAVCSQFEQHVRAVCGLPLSEPSLKPGIGGAAMVNLLGDHLPRNPDLNPDLNMNLTVDPVAWAASLPANSHGVWYGKASARPGRKMGHINVLAASPDEAVEQALAHRAALNTATPPTGTKPGSQAGSQPIG